MVRTHTIRNPGLEIQGLPWVWGIIACRKQEYTWVAHPIRTLTSRTGRKDEWKIAWRIRLGGATMPCLSEFFGVDRT